MSNTYTPAKRLEIAETILAQLGGNQFRAMTGARHFVALDAGLQFRLPNARTANGVQHVRIMLEPSDLYAVTFFRGDWTIIGESFDNIYCDQLADLFEDVTGLRTTLGTH